MFFEGQRVGVQLPTKLTRAEKILKTPLPLKVSDLPVSLDGHGLGFQNDIRGDENRTTTHFLGHLSSQGHKIFFTLISLLLT